jgi:cation efflux family protein
LAGQAHCPRLAGWSLRPARTGDFARRPEAHARDESTIGRATRGFILCGGLLHLPGLRCSSSCLLSRRSPPGAALLPRCNPCRPPDDRFLHCIHRARYLRVGRRTNSIMLEAYGKHVLTDSWTSFGVAAGRGLVLLSHWKPFDPLVAIAIALNIPWSGRRLVWGSAVGLLDYSDPEADQRIRALASSASTLLSRRGTGFLPASRRMAIRREAHKCRRASSTTCCERLHHNKRGFSINRASVGTKFVDAIGLGLFSFAIHGGSHGGYVCRAATNVAYECRSLLSVSTAEIAPVGCSSCLK